jgi:PKD repeat protein
MTTRLPVGEPSVVGSSVTFTATVSPSTATGIVQFYADGVTLGGAVALSGSGAASYSTAALTVDTHVITATYSGDLNHTGSTGTFNQLVSAACTSVAGVDFNFAPAVPTVGQPVNFTATVISGTAPITYTWNFGDGADVVTTAAAIVHSFPLTATIQTYAVTLMAANACTTSPADATRQVTVVPYFIYLPLIIR